VSGEFGLIARHFVWPAPGADLGVGDDAALLSVGAGMQLVVSTDLLVSGTHFLADTDAQRLGHKALAVNLSDMAAMGARPRWAMLALALPAVDEAWLSAFALGLRTLAEVHSTELVGGDTTRGPLTIGITILGEVPRGQALRRDRAQPGDDIWVSGTLGDAAVALAQLNGAHLSDAHLPDAHVPDAHLLDAELLDAAAFDHCRRRLEAPEPRVALGVALRGLANAAIDISDGFAADLGHILERSQVAARVQFDLLPRSPALQGRSRQPSVVQAIIAGGDDYELCFTAPRSARAQVEAAALAAATPVTRCGEILAGAGLQVLDADGHTLPLTRSGFDHFG